MRLEMGELKNVVYRITRDNINRAKTAIAYNDYVEVAKVLKSNKLTIDGFKDLCNCAIDVCDMFILNNLMMTYSSFWKNDIINDIYDHALTTKNYRMCNVLDQIIDKINVEINARNNWNEHIANKINEQNVNANEKPKRWWQKIFKS